MRLGGQRSANSRAPNLTYTIQNHRPNPSCLVRSFVPTPSAAAHAAAAARPATESKPRGGGRGACCLVAVAALWIVSRGGESGYWRGEHRRYSQTGRRDAAGRRVFRPPIHPFVAPTPTTRTRSNNSPRTCRRHRCRRPPPPPPSCRRPPPPPRPPGPPRRHRRPPPRRPRGPVVIGTAERERLCQHMDVTSA